MSKKENCFMLILLCSLPFSHENCLNQNYIYMYGEEIKDYILHGCQIETVFTEGILACYQRCLRHVKCNSINFDTGSQKPFGKCELNGRKSSESHQLIYRPGYIFVQTVNTKPLKSCAEIHQRFPSAKSGNYWIQIGQVKTEVYCDMENFGGGWTLVVSISSTNNDHLQRNAHNCLESTLCVPFKELNIISRKLSDEYIHHLANCEGTFRLDVYPRKYTVFYKFPQGTKYFDSECNVQSGCPRIIISHHYPYKWETNKCTTIDQGYYIWKAGCHRVFDAHDDDECGVRFYSSLYGSQRALYGYTCAGNHGIYYRKTGMLYVK